MACHPHEILATGHQPGNILRRDRISKVVYSGGVVSVTAGLILAASWSHCSGDCGCVASHGASLVLQLQVTSVLPETSVAQGMLQ